jgi:FKBP-type peptidyl-prolyl cis-trans isomerase FkpA
MRMVLFVALIMGAVLTACQSDAGKLLTPQGYEYIKHTNKEGAKPQPGDYAFFHAYVRNGEEVLFTSRVQKDPPFMQMPYGEEPGRQISPVEEVLREMAVGDSVTILIRLDTVPQKPQGFEDADVMYYDVVLVELRSEEEQLRILGEEQAREEEEAAATRARFDEVAAFAQATRQQYASGALKDQLTETQNRLKYIIHEEGTGPAADIGRVVKVHYYGMLTDGTPFDNSFDRGEPIAFPLGQGRVIPGWEEGIGLLKEGARATLFIPHQLAYGERGSPPTIPGNAELVFYVELVSVE